MGIPDDFLEDATPALAFGVIPREISDPPIIVLVIDDPEDEQLGLVIADHGGTVPAEGLAGAWASRIGAETSVRFTLERAADGFERRWTLSDLNEEIVAASRGAHYVAVLPSEFAGDVSSFTDLNRLYGSVIVCAAATRALESVWGVMKH